MQMLTFLIAQLKALLRFSESEIYHHEMLQLKKLTISLLCMCICLSFLLAPRTFIKQTYEGWRPEHSSKRNMEVLRTTVGSIFIVYFTMLDWMSGWINVSFWISFVPIELSFSREKPHMSHFYRWALFLYCRSSLSECECNKQQCLQTVL